MSPSRFERGLLYEADMVADALERSRVPFVRQVESVSGLTLSMPVSPAPGSGLTWLVLVPRTRLASAKRVIRKLPVSHGESAGIWGVRPRLKAKLFYKQSVWLFIIAVALSALWNLIRIFRP